MTTTRTAPRAPATRASAPTKPATAPTRPATAVKRMTFQDELARLNKLFAEDNRVTCLRALIYGASGTGKSTSLRTARRPLMVHSFDPGSAKSLIDLIDEGDAFVDFSFENENPKSPTAFLRWDKVFTDAMNGDVFNHVGTYVIDSATTWSQCIMYQTLKNAGRPGTFPQQNDYGPMMNALELAIRRLLTLPCDVILIAHEAPDKDEITGRITRAPLFTGKLTTRIPLLFDEVYWAHTARTAAGTEYRFLTASDGVSVAKSRLAATAERAGNKIEAIIPQDFGLVHNMANLSMERVNFSSAPKEQAAIVGAENESDIS